MLECMRAHGTVCQNEYTMAIPLGISVGYLDPVRLSQLGESMRWLYKNMVVDGIRSDRGSMNNGPSLQEGYPYKPSPSHWLS